MVTYLKAPPYIIDLAQELIAEFHHGLGECSIGFVLFEGDKVSKGNPVLGQTTKVTPKMLPLLSEPVDFVIELSSDFVHVRGEKPLRALIDHELCHIRRSDDGYTLRGHDIEEFTCIVERYGLWNADLLAAGPAMAQANPAEQLSLPLDKQPGKVVSVDFKG